MKLYITPLIIALTLILGSHVSAQAQALSAAQQKLDGRIETNRIRLEERQIRPERAIPPQVLNAAKGLVIINRVKIGLVFGAEIGNGIALVKNAEGKWSPPAFVSIGKGSWGAQIGADNTITFLVLMTDDSLKILRGGNAASVGLGLKATAGPLGAGGDITSATLKKPILAYSSATGAFAGASVEIGGLAGAANKNRDMYRMTMDQILFSGTAFYTPTAMEFIKSVLKHSGTPLE